MSEIPVSSGVERRPAPRLALTAAEAAEALGMSLDFLQEHVSPELRWIRRGRKRLVSVRELERWLDENATLDLGERGRS